jgi:hypothetical protein
LRGLFAEPVEAIAKHRIGEPVHYTSTRSTESAIARNSAGQSIRPVIYLIGAPVTASSPETRVWTQRMMLATRRGGQRLVCGRNGGKPSAVASGTCGFQSTDAKIAATTCPKNSAQIRHFDMAKGRSILKSIPTNSRWES